jgi:purine-binding chemotaxis protein CheW
MTETGNIHEAVSDPEEIRRILEERAAALARGDEAEDTGEAITLLVMSVGAERYGIDIGSVRETKAIPPLTTIPATPIHWLGLANLRGLLCPVLDLARYLGIPSGAAGLDDARLVVIAGDDISIGLQVDAVTEIRSVPVEAIGPSLVEASAERPELQIGLTPDLLTVLDAEALLGDPALVVNDGVD